MTSVIDHTSRATGSRNIRAYKFGSHADIVKSLFTNESICNFFDRVFPDDTYCLEENSVCKSFLESFATTFCCAEFEPNALHLVTAITVINFYGTHDMTTRDVELLIAISYKAMSELAL